MTPARRASNARRARECRARQKLGEAIFRVRGRGSVVNMLVSTGWLSQADADDHKKTEDALSRMLADASKDFA